MSIKGKHFSTVVVLVCLYISLGVFLYTYIMTNGENIKKINVNEIRKMWNLATVFTLFLSLFLIASLILGFSYLNNLDSVSPRTKRINKINGVLLLFGGLFFALPITIYLLLIE